MYVILVYDVATANGGEKRVVKLLKLCRRYLNWIQNSVCEGEITELKLKELLAEAKLFMNIETDSIIIFKSRNAKWLHKEIVGKEVSKIDNFL